MDDLVLGESREVDPTGGIQPTSQQSAANNTLEAQYWQALSPSTNALPKTGTDDNARLCNVYYFHTDQVGMPQELANAQGQVIWQASYKTWGSTVSAEWEAKTLGGSVLHPLDKGDSPTAQDEKQQNLRFQGQYLDGETGLHYTRSGITMRTWGGLFVRIRLGWMGIQFRELLAESYFLD